MICMMYRMNNKVTKKALVCSAHHRKYKGKNATRKMAWNSIDIHPCCDLDFIVYAEPDIRSKSIRSALIILFGVVVVEFDWFDDEFEVDDVVDDSDDDNSCRQFLNE